MKILLLFFTLIILSACSPSEEKKCAQGDLQECSNLGTMKQNENKLTEAESLFQKACEGNEQISCYKLADILWNKNKKNEATPLLVKACKLGVSEACNSLNVVAVNLCLHGDKSSCDSIKSKCKDGDQSACKIAPIEDSCEKVSSMFGKNSKLSSIQQKELWENYKDRIFKWKLIAVDVSESKASEGYNVTFKCQHSESFILDGTISFPENAKTIALKIVKDRSYVFQGKLSDYSSLFGLDANVISIAIENPPKVTK